MLIIGGKLEVPAPATYTSGWLRFQYATSRIAVVAVLACDQTANKLRPDKQIWGRVHHPPQGSYRTAGGTSNG